MAATLVGRENDLRRARKVLDDRGAVLLHGPSGIGKTAICDVLADEWLSNQQRVVEIRGTEGLRNVPFGALTLSLPLSLEGSDSDILARVRALLADGEDQVLVVVDDTHLLDPQSAAVVSGLAQVSDVALAMAVTSGERVSSDITALWARWPECRIEVGPLARAEVQELVKNLTGVMLDTRMTEVVESLTLGYPLYVTAVASELAHLQVVEGPDLESWIHALSGSTDRLVRLMERRLGRLDREDRRLFDLIAFAEDLPLAIFSDQSSIASLESLNGGGLVRVTADRVQVAHPLLGSVARSTLTTEGRRSCARLAISLLDGQTEDGDVAAVVRKALNVGVVPDVEHLRAAAEVAFNSRDYGSVSRITGVVPEDPQLRTLRARAGRFLGEVPDTDIPLGLDDDGLTEYLSGTSHAIAYVERRFTDAIDYLRDGMGLVQGQQNRNRLALELMILSALVGDLDAMLGASRIAADNSDPGSRLLALSSTQLAEALTLSTASAEDTYAEGRVLVDEGATQGMLEEQLAMSRVMVHLAEGRFMSARAGCESFGEKTLAGSWLTVESVLADAWLPSAEALRLAEAAVASLEEFDPLANLAQARYVADMRRAQLGLSPASTDHATHEEGVARIDQLMSQRADAWWALADGDSTAAKRLVEVGREGVAMGHRFWGLCAFIDAIRLGAGEEVVGDIEHLVITRGAGLAVLAARAARASMPEERWALSRDWWSAGADTYAIEAGLRNAESGDIDCQLMVHLMARRGAKPLIGDLSSMESPLSDRQIETVEGVLRGATNESLAEELFVSRRTIENHLHNAYQALSVRGGREELRDRFGWVYRESGT